MRRDPEPSLAPALSRPGARAAASRERWFDRLAAAAISARVDIAIVCAITLLAGVLRIWHLGTVPLGLHGDEAWTGIDARRVLDEGYIGPYLPSAIGQPIGPVYVTALLFKLSSDTTFVLRLSMALFGIATIPLAYCAFATMFNRTVAAFAALLLTVMMWHLHLSRTGFMVVSWPFIEMAVLLALWQARRRQSLPLFALAGALAGLGVYSYNAYALFLPIPFVALVWWYLPRRGTRWPRISIGVIGVFVGVALVVSLPLLRYINDHGFEYRFHQRAVSVTNSQEWSDADALGRADIIWDRAREWGRGLVVGDRADLGDGLATKGHPVIDPITLLLALVGIGVAIWNWRRAEYAVLLAAVVILPWGALLTLHDGLFRRTFGMAPFVAVLAALPLAWMWERMARGREPVRYAYLAALLAIPAIIGATTVYSYFGSVQRTFEMKYVYPYQLDAASRYVADLPPGTFVYFYSDRWSFDYETRQFLAPNAEGTDRSREFRLEAPENRLAPVDYSARIDRNVAFVFLAPYDNQAAVQSVVNLHPGGEVTRGAREGETLYLAYYLPKRRFSFGISLAGRPCMHGSEIRPSPRNSHYSSRRERRHLAPRRSRSAAVRRRSAARGGCHHSRAA